MNTGTYAISGSALLAERERLNLIASNIANADSLAAANGQPYRARFAVFAPTPTEDGAQGAVGPAGVRVERVMQSSAPFKKTYAPGNPLANAQGYVVGSNVSLVRQMTDLVNATQSYRANLAMLTQGERLDQALIATI